MKAKKKTVFMDFDYTRCDDFAQYLSRMAAKGWHFKGWGIGLQFVQGEPEQAIYAVEVFPKANENDMRPGPRTQEFAEYCEAAGWEFIDAKQKFCIFKKKSADAVDLFTPQERVINVYKGVTSGSAILLLVLYGLNAVLGWVNLFTAFERNIFASSFLLGYCIWNMLFLGQVGTSIYAYWKKKQWMKKIKEEEKIHIGIQADGKKHLSWKSIYMFLLFLLLSMNVVMLGKTELILMNVICVGITLLFVLIVAKLRPDSGTNVLIQTVFSLVFILLFIVMTAAIIFDDNDVAYQKDELPLQISDYREFNETITTVDIYQERNIFGSCERYYIFSNNSAVHYVIYRTEQDWILEKIWKEELNARKLENAVDCTELWNAQKAFCVYGGMYYVRYEDVLLVFSEDSDIEFSAEQIAIIREKLNIK